MTAWADFAVRHSTMLVALALLLFTAALWTVPINHDSAFLFVAGERFLTGQSLYLDQSLVNPPLTIILHAGAALIGHAVGLGVHVLLPLGVLTVAVSLWLGMRVLALSPTFRPARRAALMWVGFAALAVVPVANFMQRDHLFAVFAFPYLLLLGLRLDGQDASRKLAVAVGAFAFFGMALKPHFLLLPLVLEGVLAFRTRQWTQMLRAETLTLSGCLTLYALSVAVFYPEYFTTVLPRYIDVFSAFTRPFSALLTQPEVILAGIAVVSFLYAYRATHQLPGVVLSALATMVCALAIYFLQKKGWSYQLAPTLTFTTVAVASMLILREDRETITSSTGLWAWATLIGVAGLVVLRGPYANYHQDHAASKVAELARGKAAYVFTSNVSFPYPTFLYQDVTPASRFNTLWMLPALARADVGERDLLQPVERFARDAVLDDFHRHEPYVVGIDVRERKPYFQGVAFDYLNWALRDPRFAIEWQNYRLVEKTNGFAIYIRKQTPQ